MRLHAIVADLETARAAVEGGASVLQLRLKGASTDDLVAQGGAYRSLCQTAGIAFVVNVLLTIAQQRRTRLWS